MVCNWWATADYVVCTLYSRNPSVAQL